ncbi:hypothetical protein V8C86DRAFT_3089672 [Haematococcus lacustris]
MLWEGRLGFLQAPASSCKRLEREQFYKEDAEVDGSGRAEAVLSESKARSTQEAPRGCETEHPRPA